MAGPTNFSAPYRLITMAYQDAGLTRAGVDLTSDQLASGMLRLNDLINLWQTQGLKLWKQVDTTVTLVAGQAKYTFKPGGDINITKPLRVLQGYYLTPADGNRRPIYPISWNEYLTLSITTSLGEINSYFVDKKAAQLDVYFWLTPDSITASSGEAHLLLQQQVINFTALTDTMDFPVEWFIALRWGLSDDLSTGQPESIQARCKAKADEFRNALEAWDVEDAPTSFEPDSRLSQSVGRFR